MTVHINDCRAFGRQVLCGTHVIDTLHRYFVDPNTWEPRRPPEEELGNETFFCCLCHKDKIKKIIYFLRASSIIS